MYKAGMKGGCLYRNCMMVDDANNGRERRGVDVGQRRSIVLDQL